MQFFFNFFSHFKVVFNALLVIGSYAHWSQNTTLRNINSGKHHHPLMVGDVELPWQCP
jgi:hypothetical protein